MINKNSYKKVKVYKNKNFVSFNISKRKIYADENSVSAIIEEFLGNYHKDISVKDKIVFDIGGYMGETALLYHANGARHVYTFEPVNYLFNITKKNIRLNKLDAKITAINAFVIGGHKIFDSNDFELNKNKKIRTVNINKFKINNIIMKVDCEGGEYEIIKNITSNTLKKFEAIQIEYHYGYKNIYEYLKKEGFDVFFNKPHLSIVGKFNKVKYMGDLFAYKKNKAEIK